MELNNQSLFQQQCWINGNWVNADNHVTFPVTNPANGETLGEVPQMGVTETRRAIEAAHAAFPSWKALLAQERSVILRKWYDLLLENQSDLAKIMTLEQGKPFAESMGEVLYAASFIAWFAEEARRTYGDVIPTHHPNARIVVTKEPIGVVAAITPWNFPLAMITRKMGAALAAGCTMVYKPDEKTPLSAFALAQLGETAGVPPGVFNVITGIPSEIGGELTSNPIVRKLTFTGSTQVGKLLLEQCAKTVKKTSMELGGNAPFIVFDDADVDRAVQGAMIAKYRNGGQTCVCTNRFYAQSKIHDEFVGKLAAQVQAMKVGNGLEKGVAQGPMIEARAVEKVERHVDDALAQGGTLICGGKRHALGGNFYEPTIITNVTHTMQVCQEETFGPLSAVIRFETEDEVIRMANDTEFGLASYFYTRDLGRAWRVAEALETGMVGINEGLISSAVAPFGGVKESGIGREGSKYGIDDYLEPKYMLMGGVLPKQS